MGKVQPHLVKKQGNRACTETPLLGYWGKDPVAEVGPGQVISQNPGQYLLLRTCRTKTGIQKPYPLRWISIIFAML